MHWSGSQYTDMNVEGLDKIEMAAPAKFFMNQIKQQATSHSSWTVESESEKIFDILDPVTGDPVSQTGFPELTLRCAGASNAHGKDFFVTFVTTATRRLAKQPKTGWPESGPPEPPPFLYREVFVTLCEDYTAGEPPTLGRPVPGPALELSSPGPDGSVGGGRAYNLYYEKDPKTDAPGLNTGQLFLQPMRLNNAARYRYCVYASNNTLAIFVGPPGPAGTNQQNVMACGVFQTLMEQDPFPLFLSTGNEARITRMPYVVAGQPDNWELQYSWTPGKKWTVASGVLNQGGDLMHSGRPLASRLVVMHKGRSDTHGGLRGIFFDAVQFLSGRPPQIGDAVVIDGKPMAVIHTTGTGAGGGVGTTTVVDLSSP